LLLQSRPPAQMTNIDKTEILVALLTRLRATLDNLTASQQAVQSGATHPEARQEHPKDTRSIEAGYLARGLAERVETLRDGIRALDLLRVRDFADDEAAAPGALVTVVDDDGREAVYFLAPAGGGESLCVAGCEVLVLTPRSPLGAAIAGKRSGDAVTVDLPSGTLRAEIDGVA
jgi:transcription elongation GreA/GreB family factor